MAIRDAELFRNPDTQSPKVYHVIAGPDYVAACDSWLLLVQESETSLSSTSAGMRCRRPGCYSRWKGEQ